MESTEYTGIKAALEGIGVTDETHDVDRLAEAIIQHDSFAGTRCIDSIPDNEFWQMVADADHDLRDVGPGLYRDEAMEATKMDAAVIAHIIQRGTDTTISQLRAIARSLRESGLVDRSQIPEWGSDEWPLDK